MKKLSYRVIRFPKVNRFVALAWNYDEAIIIATAPHASYELARIELDELCVQREDDVVLSWFDGEYDCVNDILLPCTDE